MKAFVITTVLWFGLAATTCEAAAPCAAPAAPSAQTPAAAVELFPIVQDAKWGYMDKAGKVVIQPKYDCAWDFAEGLACVQVGLLRGYIDAAGKMVIQPKYVIARPFSEGVAAVYEGGPMWGGLFTFNYGTGSWVYIDKAGQVAVKPKGSVTMVAGEFHGGLAAVSYVVGRSTWFAVLTRDGSIRPPPGGYIANVGRCCEGLVAYQPTRDKFGYVDAAGKEAIPAKFEAAGEFSDGLAPVAMLLDLNEPARTKVWAKASKHGLNLATWGAAALWGIGRVPLDDADAIGHGQSKTFTFSVTAPAKVGKYTLQWQMLQEGGPAFGDQTPPAAVEVVAEDVPAPAAKPAENPVVQPVAAASPAAPPAPAAGGPPQLNGATFVSQDIPAKMTAGKPYTLTVTMKNTGPKVTRWAFIDKAGAAAIPPQFASARSFSEGLAAVAIGEEKTAADPRGKPVVTTVLRWGCIDKTGKRVIQAQYDFVGPLTEGLARIVVAGKHGYIDAAGKVIVEPKFEVAWEFSKGLARVEADGPPAGSEPAKVGYIDKAGTLVRPPTN